MRFATKDEEVSHTMKIPLIEKVNLLSTYRDRGNIRLRIGKVIPEIKLEWVVATILSTNEYNFIEQN